MEWAHHEFRLNKRGEDETSERDHLNDALEKAERRGDAERVAEILDQLDGPELPEDCDQVVIWFTELGYCLAGGYGPVPLTFTEIQAWAELRKISPTPDEVDAIRSLSIVYCNVQNSKG